MQSLRRVFAIASLVIIAVFAVQNLKAVDITLLTWTINVPKVVVILAAYLLGMVTGWGFFGFVKRSMKSQKASN